MVMISRSGEVYIAYRLRWSSGRGRKYVHFIFRVTGVAKINLVAVFSPNKSVWQKYLKVKE